MAPHPFDIRHTGPLDLIPDQGRFHEALRYGVVGRRSPRPGAAEDRIVAMVDPLNADDGLGPGRAGVVTGPLAEGSFFHDVVRLHEAFDDDFSLGRERKSGYLTLNDLDRAPLESAGVIELGDAVVDLVARDHEEDRVLTDGNDNRAGLSLLEPFTALNGAMLSRRDVERHTVLVVDHAPVGAEVHPTFFRIFRNDQTGGADETAAVELMHERNREL